MKRWITENKSYIKTTLGVAWPAVLESFFVALVGMVDSLMVSRLGTYAGGSSNPDWPVPWQA